MTLHSTGWPRAHASVPMQPAQGRRIGGGLERNRAPLDAGDGVPVSAMTVASGATSLAVLAPTALRRVWHFANSASQLVTPDASRGVIWALHMTPNVASTARIGARLLQRKKDESEPTTVNPMICDGECLVQCEPKGGGLESDGRMRCVRASRHRTEAIIRRWRCIGRLGDAERGSERGGLTSNPSKNWGKPEACVTN